MENIRFLLNKIEIYVTFCYIVQKNGKKKRIFEYGKGKAFQCCEKKNWRDTRQYFRQLFYESKYTKIKKISIREESVKNSKKRMSHFYLNREMDHSSDSFPIIYLKYPRPSILLERVKIKFRIFASRNIYILSGLGGMLRKKSFSFSSRLLRP